MGAGFPSLVDRLLAALYAAKAALQAGATGAGRIALDEAFAALGALYATLDSKRHPELSAYLQFVYDGCLQSIGGATPGHWSGLSSAITLLHHVRRAEEGACSRAWPGDRPSFIARALGI
jgi:flagellin-specific chaperone FliS